MSHKVWVSPRVFAVTSVLRLHLSAGVMAKATGASPFAEPEQRWA